MCLPALAGRRKRRGTISRGVCLDEPHDVIDDDNAEKKKENMMMMMMMMGHVRLLYVCR